MGFVWLNTSVQSPQFKPSSKHWWSNSISCSHGSFQQVSLGCTLPCLPYNEPCHTLTALLSITHYLQAWLLCRFLKRLLASQVVKEPGNATHVIYILTDYQLKLGIRQSTMELHAYECSRLQQLKRMPSGDNKAIHPSLYTAQSCSTLQHTIWINFCSDIQVNRIPRYPQFSQNKELNMHIQHLGFDVRPLSLIQS